MNLKAHANQKFKIHILRNLAFTIEQIKKAHEKLKSGADFPAYIGEIKNLGVVCYEVFVADGRSDYCGANGYKISAPTKYEPLQIAESADSNQFKLDLIAHQQGKTNYLTFCSDCAKSGVNKWLVHLEQMTCTYYDKAGNVILVETIPS
jgi:uncharacterized protein YbcV (DUF1398 family)